MSSSEGKSLQGQLRTLVILFLILAGRFALLLVIVPTATPATPIMFSGFFAIATSLLIYWVIRFNLERSGPLLFMIVLFNLIASASLAYLLATVVARALAS